MKREKVNKSKLLLEIAEEESYHSNSWYRQKCKDVYGVTVSASQVVATLGKHQDRLTGSLTKIKHSARRLLDLCNDDQNLACRIVRRLANA